MKSEQHLMQRVRMGTDGSKISVQFNFEKYKASVYEHLQKIFNTRQGSCLANPDYGLPDFNDLDMKYGFTIATKEVIKSIKNNIALYEKGLSRVRVKYIRDEISPLELRFEIVAILRVSGKTERIRFETKKSSSGTLEVH